VRELSERAEGQDGVARGTAEEGPVTVTEEEPAAPPDARRRPGRWRAGLRRAEVVADAAEEPRRRRWFRRSLLVALVFALAGAGLQVLSARARHDPALGNRALVDTEATSVVIGDVSNGLSKIFSYAPDSTATTEQDAAEVLGGTAAGQYRTLFAQVKQHAAAERLTVTTRVVRAGVVRLTRDTAQLLVFLDQVIIRKDRPEGMSATAQLSVTARLDGGHWRIVDMRAR
jgi:Mce-associated membrane protein